MLNDQTALDVTAPVEAPKDKPKGKGRGKGKGMVAPKAKPNRATRRKLSIRQRVAVGAGGVATGLLGLSVVHLTESISLLTGSPPALSAFLALGIDAGMLAAEGAGLVSTDSTTKTWAGGYVMVACVASMALNAFAFVQHASGGVWGQVAAVGLGILIPGLVLALGKFGGRLWLEK